MCPEWERNAESALQIYRPPHNEQGCSERICSRRERSRPGTRWQWTSLHALFRIPLAPDSPYFFLTPRLALRIDQRSAKIREPLLRPLYMPSHSHFAELSYFASLCYMLQCWRVSRESILFAPFMRCCRSKPEQPTFYLLSKLYPVIRESEIKYISLWGGIFQRRQAGRVNFWVSTRPNDVEKLIMFIN